MQPSKISMAAIEQLRQVFKTASECRVEEVTKVQAIRMLAPEIYEMQSKGYSLGAIAGMCSDKGIAVTAVALKSYLNQAKVAGSKKALRKRKQRQEVDRVRSDDPRSVVQTADDRASQVAAKEVRSAGASGERVAREAAVPVAANGGAKEWSKGPPPRAAEGGQRRSAFVPKDDSEDI